MLLENLGLDSTYEGLKRFGLVAKLAKVKSLDSTYEGLKHGT